MNLKEMLLIVGIALATTWGIEYLFFSKQDTKSDQQVQSGQSFIAPKAAQELKPLQTEVDFIDTKRPAQPQLTEVDTNGAVLVFSTDGASLERLEFKRSCAGCPEMLGTLFPPATTEKEKRCFLVALQDKTPYYFTLIDDKDAGVTRELTYQAESDGTLVTKKFIIFKNVYRITMSLTIKPAPGATINPRIIYPAPVMQDIASEDVKSGLVSDERGSITTLARTKINPEMYWASPAFFGAEDRYFVYAMVDDATHFVQRAYFRLAGQNELFSILEGPTVDQPTTWDLSYYFGPKESAPMVAVDPRLEQTLGYAGWLAPIAKWLLVLLNFLFDYLGNYGLAIIALTIITKLVLLPFSIKGNQSMKRQAEVQRKLKYLQQRYKNEPELLAKEREELMRREGLGSLTGCLPLLLQLPIFFALSRVLSTSLELYRAPFYGWITDLSARDPYYILPLLVVLVMLLQASSTDTAQRVQMIIMALVFGAITATLSAGLCLYIFMSTLLGVVQTGIQKQVKAA